MLRRPVSMIPVVVALALVASVAAGCSQRVLQYRDSGRALQLSDVRELARRADLGRAEQSTVDEAAGLRTEALTELRSHGKEAQRLADALTAQLPADYRGVPVYVERATVDGRDCWIVVEARPPAEGGGTLAGRRYWVFDSSSLAVVESGAL